MTFGACPEQLSGSNAQCRAATDGNGCLVGRLVNTQKRRPTGEPFKADDCDTNAAAILQGFMERDHPAFTKFTRSIPALRFCMTASVSSGTRSRLGFRHLKSSSGKLESKRLRDCCAKEGMFVMVPIRLRSCQPMLV